MGRADEKFTAVRAVVKILREAAGVRAFGVERKIFPLVAPEGTDGDFLVYQRDGYERQDTKMGIALQQSVIYVIAVSMDYDRSLSLAEAVYTALEGDHPDEDVRIRLEDYSEEYADKKFLQVLRFTIQ